MKFSKFPIGSEVVVTHETYGTEPVGTKGKVVKSDQAGRALVKFGGSGFGTTITWYFSDDGEDGRIELVEKKKKKPEFKVGDVVISSESATQQLMGTVVEAEVASCLVQFPSWDKGHDGGAFDDSKDKWWVENEYLSKVAVEKKKKAPKGKQAYRGNGKHSWEPVTGNTVRLRVPGGWLYGRASTVSPETVRDAVFVPVPQAVGYAV
jgi:hypothetical protein